MGNSSQSFLELEKVFNHMYLFVPDECRQLCTTVYFLFAQFHEGVQILCVFAHIPVLSLTPQLFFTSFHLSRRVAAGSFHPRRNGSNRPVGVSLLFKVKLFIIHTNPESLQKSDKLVSIDAKFIIL